MTNQLEPNQFFEVKHRSDDTDAIGNVQGVVVLREMYVGLLLSIWSNKRVYLCALNVVHGADSLFDLQLGGLDVHQEYEGIDFFDLLHRRFCSHRALNDT